MSMMANVLFNIMPDITPKIDRGRIAYSLRSRDYKDAQMIILENHPNDSRVRIADVFQTLSGRIGTGGGAILRWC